MPEDDSANLDWSPQGNSMQGIIEHWRQQQGLAAHAASMSTVAGVLSVRVADSIHLTDEAKAEMQSLPTYPDVLLQAAVVVLGDKTSEGRIVESASVAWFEIVKELNRDPDFFYKIPSRKVEELIAGAYERAGWEVTLTPRSGDRGRDVIAVRPGIISFRIIDEIKAYSAGRLVTAKEVRSLLGVLSGDHNVSKGLVTTTSRFAPGIEKDPFISPFMPYRLELKDGEQIRQWLSELLARKGSRT